MAALLHCTVPELRGRISRRELADWRLFLEEHERKIEKLDYYFTRLCVLLGAFHGVEIEPEDVLIFYEKSAEPPAALEPVTLALTLARNLGAIVIDNRKR